MIEDPLRSFSEPYGNGDQNLLRRTKKRKTAIDLTFGQRLVISNKAWEQVSRNELEYLQSMWKALRRIIEQEDNSKMPL